MSMSFRATRVSSRAKRGICTSVAAFIGLGAPSAPVVMRMSSVDEPVRVTITSADIRASNEEAAAAHGALVSMWTNELRSAGYRFAAPRLARYRGTTRTSCGIMPGSNASYCYDNNTIYFDDAFLAAQTKITGQVLGTDGDMAAVGIIAHEMGHAVALQLGAVYRSTYQNESIADCLAGAFARQAQTDGSLEPGDLDEAFYAMAAAADPEWRSTGDRRVDARRAAILARDGHGTREQRQANFRRGLTRGGAGCLGELR
jgi:predicted metalloprotease